MRVRPQALLRALQLVAAAARQQQRPVAPSLAAAVARLSWLHSQGNKQQLLPLCSLQHGRAYSSDSSSSGGDGGCSSCDAAAAQQSESAPAAADAAAVTQPPLQSQRSLLQSQLTDRQQQQQQQPLDPAAAEGHSSSREPPSPDAQLNELLQLVCHNPSRLQPAQLTIRPSMAQLQDNERKKLAGSPAVQPARIREEAYANLSHLLKRFQASRGTAERARAAHIPKALLPVASAAFRKWLSRAATPGLTAAIIVASAAPPEPDTAAAAAAGAAQPGEAAASATGSPAAAAEAVSAAAAAGAGEDAAAGLLARYTPAVEELLMPYFIEFCHQFYKQEIDSYAAAVATLDLRSPHTWHPYARSLQRKIIYHGGPTNSGKTYNALQSLAAAERGVYCAPLRLLAMEVYETLNHRGVYCDLVTGQEVLKVPGSSHVSCTVEMANLNAHADVAVIDEIQLIGDNQRGFAWTRALLGLPANTIHVCGDTSAVQLVKHLAAVCGDEFELHTYDRMTPLQLDPAGLPGGWADVASGDAVVAFSRKSIYKARKAIEVATGQATCIVYGALPAETRRAQARLFNDPSSGANILIASDAIGLGLNFNIRRVIFTTLSKTSHRGRSRVRVPVSLVKQIAGRAGRRNSIYPEGCVTTLHPADLPALRQALDVPASRLTTPAAGLAPEYETIELLSGQFPGLSLEALLKKLDAEAKLDGRYFLCNQEQLLDTARVLGRVKGLSLADQFTLVNAPIDAGDGRQREAFLAFTRAYAAGEPVLLAEGLMPAAPPADEAQMADAESLHKILGLWLWLSFRFEEGSFPGRERVQAMTRKLSHWLNLGLQNIQRHSAVEQKIRNIAAAAAEAEQQQQSRVLPSGSSPAAEAADAADSSDADEINDSVFTTPVVEIPGPAAAAAAAPGGSEEGDWLLNSQDQQQQQQQEASTPAGKPRPVAYINWGSSIVSSGPSSAAGSSANDGEEDDLASPHLAPAAAEQLLSEAHYLAGSASVEALEQLMMPEFDPSMAPFVRWKSRPRFVVPPRPEPVC